jgi:hypothetical protein
MLSSVWNILYSSVAWGGQALELCNALDDDGDGAVDEAPLVFAPDLDGDGAGDSRALVLLLDCNADPVLVADISDCDDTLAELAPGAAEQCDGVDNDCDGAIDEGACPGTVTPGEGRAWLVVTEGTDWSSAAAECEQLGFELATPATQSEQLALEGALATATTVSWIGLTDQAAEGTWLWIDGTALSYDNWRTGEPNDSGGVDSTGAAVPEDCAEFEVGGTWDDQDCLESKDYVCERPCPVSSWHPDSDGDGLGDEAVLLADCVAPEGYVPNGADCDDSDATQPSRWYLDSDGDSFGSTEVLGCGGPSLVQVDGDCDDQDLSIHPGAEDPHDGLDQDCDGEDSPEEPPVEEEPEEEPEEPAEEEPPEDEPEDEPEAPSLSDSDGDGVPDPIDPEPSWNGSSAQAPPGAEFGCGCASAHPTGAWMLALLWLRWRRSEPTP